MPEMTCGNGNRESGHMVAEWAESPGNRPLNRLDWEQEAAIVADGSYRFTVGAVGCTAIADMEWEYAASRFFTNAPDEELEKALREHGLEPEHIPATFTCLYIETGTTKVLVDAGAGTGIHPQKGPYQGKLLDNLKSIGVAAGDIDIVVITHAHGDHVGGVTGESGDPTFPNARHVMWRDEWDFWMSEDAAESEPAFFVETARGNLSVLGDRLDLLDGESEIAAGIFAVDARGHTPGHMAVAVRSEGQELLYTSDAVLHPIHLERPEWETAFYDHDLEQAAESKNRLFDHAAEENALVLAFHFSPFPSLGRILKKDHGWDWAPMPETV